MTTTETVFVFLVYFFAVVGLIAFIKRLIWGKKQPITVKIMNILPSFEVDSKPENKKKVIYRSSETGKIVTEKFAKENPTTTEREEIN